MLVTKPGANSESGCLSSSVVCDRKWQCSDGSDEYFCQTFDEIEDYLDTLPTLPEVSNGTAPIPNSEGKDTKISKTRQRSIEKGNLFNKNAGGWGMNLK